MMIKEFLNIVNENEIDTDYYYYFGFGLWKNCKFKIKQIQ